MAAIFQAAIDLFPNSQVPKDREQRNQVLDAFTPSQEKRLEQLSRAFTDYPDALSSLLDTYVEEHEEDFSGPKTLMEQWNARRARGAETRPQGVSEWDLDKEATTDAQFTDRKCPICGQSAPNHRKTCRRCGYPYGRAVEQS
jgi:DNA repair exonuclease SbcCD ATPase subunit